MGKRIPQEKREKIFNMYGEYGCQQIALEVGMDIATIFRMVGHIEYKQDQVRAGFTMVYHRYKYREMAEMMGLSPQTIRSFANGKDVTIPVLWKIVDWLGHDFESYKV